MAEHNDAPRFLANSPQFLKALQLAASLHARQTRKGTDIPYVSHLLQVSGIAVEYGGGEEEAIGALLHDAAEDCGGRPTLERIRREFGEGVAHIVEGCTDTFEEPKPEWKKRKAEYISRIAHEPKRVRLVSAADKLHNARALLADYRTLGERVFDRFRKGTQWCTVWHYRRLADAFIGAEPTSALARELNHVVVEVEWLVGADTGQYGESQRQSVYEEMDERLKQVRA